MTTQTWTEIDRRAGAYEVSDCNNSVYVATLAEAIAVAADWMPDDWHPPLRAGMGLVQANAALAAYSDEAPTIGRVEAARG